MSGNRFFSLLLRSRSNRILYMSEYLFRGLIKFILDPLVYDSKTSIGHVGHDVSIVPSICLLLKHEVLDNTHDRRDQSSPVEQREQIPVIVNEPEQQAVFSELLLQADIGSFTAVTQEDLRNILGGTVALAVRDSGEDTTLWIMNTPEFHYIIICYPDGEQVFLKGPADVLPYQGLKEAETDSLKAASQAGTIRPPGVPSSSQAP